MVLGGLLYCVCRCGFAKYILTSARTTLGAATPGPSPADDVSEIFNDIFEFQDSQLQQTRMDEHRMDEDGKELCCLFALRGRANCHPFLAQGSGPVLRMPHVVSTYAVSMCTLLLSWLLCFKTHTLARVHIPVHIQGILIRASLVLVLCADVAVLPAKLIDALRRSVLKAKPLGKVNAIEQINRALTASTCSSSMFFFVCVVARNSCAPARTDASLNAVR